MGLVIEMGTGGASRGAGGEGGYKRPNATCKAITAPFLPGAPKGVCSHEHTREEAGEHESIWKKRAREAAEAEATPAR
jgi:hypothetical protein